MTPERRRGVEYTLNYAGDTFTLDADEAEEVDKAIRLAAQGEGVVVTFVDLKSDSAGSPGTRKFLFTAGIPVYLTESP
jgi:hypothetical protein